MPLLLSLAGSKWTWIALAFAGLSAYAGFEHWQAGRYQAEIVAAQEQVRALGVEIATQNAAVAALKAAGDAKKAAGTQALGAAMKAAQPAQAEAGRLHMLAAAKPAVEVPRKPECQPSGADHAVVVVRSGL